MKRFVTGQARGQATLFPEYLEDFIDEDNPVRVIDTFVEELDLRELGFKRVEPCATGRPGYHPAVLLKLYIYGNLNRIQSSRRLERECQRNLELMWLTAYVPKTHTSNNAANGLFRREEFRYPPETNEYRCPAGERLIWRYRSVQDGRCCAAR